MNLRRAIATLLAALMLLALTACGAGTTSPAQDANAPAEETDPPATESSQFRVGMECAYAPSNWQESAATDTNVPVENVAGAYAEGYDVQIARILADQLGKELVIVKLSWDGLIDALNQGQIDAIIAGMMDTAERRESINFSDPYKETIYSMMVLAGSPYENAASIQDFSGAAVLGQQGTALDDVIDQIEGVEHLSPVGSVPDMISRLQQGTCDAIVINEESAPGYLASNPDFRLITFSEGNGFTLPAIGNEFIINIKDSSVLCVLGVSDLMFMTRSVAGIYYKGTECYLIAATVYLFLTYLSSLLLKAITGRMTAPDNTKRRQGNQTVDLGLPSSN